MSKTKPKRIPVALLKAAYKKGRDAASRVDPWLKGTRGWDETSESERSGLRAFARYILKHQPVAIAAAAILLSGCASRTVSYRHCADGSEVVTSRTWAVLSKVTGDALSEDLQTTDFIAGTKAGSLKTEPDAETIKAITEGITAAVIKSFAPLP